MALISFSLPVPAGPGSGAAADVSTVDTIRTLIIDGGFAGTIAIEGSDNGTTFDSIVGSGLFEVAGVYPLNAAARFVRVTRAGAVSGTPTLTLVGESSTVSIEHIPAAASVVTSVAAAAATTTLLAANPERRMAVFFNDTSARALYLKYGAGASVTDYTVKILSQGYFEMPLPVETGIITGIWESGSGGAVLVTEETGTGGTGIDPSDLSILINRMTGGNSGNPQRIYFRKEGRTSGGVAASPVPRRLESMWQYIGIPSHGATPTTVAAPDNTTAGSFKQANPGAGKTQYLIAVELQSSAAARTYILYDRLLHIGGLSGTVTTPQSVGGSITRYTGTESAGNQIWVEIYTSIGATPTTITAAYTNQSGSAQTSQAVTIGGANEQTTLQLINLPLASGDSGVRGVTSVTLAGSTGTAGELGVNIVRPLVHLAIGFNADTTVRNLRYGIPSMVEIKSGACLALAYVPNAANVQYAYGSLQLVDI